MNIIETLSAEFLEHTNCVKRYNAEVIRLFEAGADAIAFDDHRPVMLTHDHVSAGHFRRPVPYAPNVTPHRYGLRGYSHNCVSAPRPTVINPNMPGFLADPSDPMPRNFGLDADDLERAINGFCVMVFENAARYHDQRARAVSTAINEIRRLTA